MVKMTDEQREAYDKELIAGMAVVHKVLDEAEFLLDNHITVPLINWATTASMNNIAEQVGSYWTARKLGLVTMEEQKEQQDKVVESQLALMFLLGHQLGKDGHELVKLAGLCGHADHTNN